MATTTYGDLVAFRRPAVFNTRSTQVLPRVVATAPVPLPQLYPDPVEPAAPVAPTTSTAPAVDGWEWTVSDRLLLPVAWLLAVRHRAPGRHRRHGGPVRSHRAGGAR